MWQGQAKVNIVQVAALRRLYRSSRAESTMRKCTARSKARCRSTVRRKALGRSKHAPQQTRCAATWQLSRRVHQNWPDAEQIRTAPQEESVGRLHCHHFAACLCQPAPTCSLLQVVQTKRKVGTDRPPQAATQMPAYTVAINCTKYSKFWGDPVWALRTASFHASLFQPSRQPRRRHAVTQVSLGGSLSFVLTADT